MLELKRSSVVAKCPVTQLRHTWMSINTAQSQLMNAQQHSSVTADECPATQLSPSWMPINTTQSHLNAQQHSSVTANAQQHSSVPAEYPATQYISHTFMHVLGKTSFWVVLQTQRTDINVPLLECSELNVKCLYFIGCWSEIETMCRKWILIASFTRKSFIWTNRIY